jgi:hypothetical protein
MKSSQYREEIRNDENMKRKASKPEIHSDCPYFSVYIIMNS